MYMSVCHWKISQHYLVVTTFGNEPNWIFLESSSVRMQYNHVPSFCSSLALTFPLFFGMHNRMPTSQEHVIFVYCEDDVHDHVGFSNIRCSKCFSHKQRRKPHKSREFWLLGFYWTFHQSEPNHCSYCCAVFVEKWETRNCIVYMGDRIHSGLHHYSLPYLLALPHSIWKPGHWAGV